MAKKVQAKKDVGEDDLFVGVRGVRGGHYANEDQKLMAAVWRTKEWTERRRELLRETPRCEWCNGPSSVINHRRQGYYEGYSLCRREEVDVICHPCHEEWTKTGKRRPRLYDTCASCGASVYLGRTSCYRCGDKDIISSSSVSGSRANDLQLILERCPEVRTGDRWVKIWSWGNDTVKVLRRRVCLGLL